MYFSCYHHRICTRLSLAWTLLFLGALVLNAVPSSAAAATRLSSEAGTYRFADLGYGDRTARTMYGSLDYFFSILPVKNRSKAHTWN
jgi:hypothetical protein